MRGVLSADVFVHGAKLAITMNNAKKFFIALSLLKTKYTEELAKLGGSTIWLVKVV